MFTKGLSQITMSDSMALLKAAEKLPLLVTLNRDQSHQARLSKKIVLTQLINI